MLTYQITDGKHKINFTKKKKAEKFLASHSGNRLRMIHFWEYGSPKQSGKSRIYGKTLEETVEKYLMSIIFALDLDNLIFFGGIDTIEIKKNEDRFYLYISGWSGRSDHENLDGLNKIYHTEKVEIEKVTADEWHGDYFKQF